jgi:hypothetical protein
MSTKAERTAARVKASRDAVARRPRRVRRVAVMRDESYPGENLDRASRAVEWGVSVSAWSGGLIERDRGRH